MISELAEPLPKNLDEKNDSGPKTGGPEVVPKTESEIRTTVSADEPKGQAEEDVAAEIKKIMSQGRFQNDSPLEPLPKPDEKKTEPTKNPSSEFPAKNEMNSTVPTEDSAKTGLTQEEIDKIKQELKKKIQESGQP